MIPAGRTFYKMSGSGNDFVFVDARRDGRGTLGETESIRRVCARGTGVGADGVVFLETSDKATVRLTYINADGSPADFCGNATLCTTRLSTELGIAPPSGLEIETDAGIIPARIRGGLPEIDLPLVDDIDPDVSRRIPLERGESRIGFAKVGVPHLVIQVGDVSTVDVVGRGRPLRSHLSLGQAGANVNWVSKGKDGRWRYRTYERGVEAETLACGSGSVATAILLATWGEARAENGVELETRSGKLLRISLRAANGGWMPSLSGEGRVVFQGQLSEI